MHAPEEVRPREESVPQVNSTRATSEKKMKPKEVVHDEAPAPKTDHPFEPRAQWWTLCKHCGFAESAHTETTLTRRDHIHYYSDDNPED